MKLTFMQARKEWMVKLCDLGWEVHLFNQNNCKPLKIAYATKSGCDTIWFHAQAVYQGPDRKSARSITSDMRNLEDIRHVKGT